ncbi:MAG: peptidoglycan-associated lipoprotein Pal [Rhodoferax sp.]|jgi:peptidoglycan-associated lipoprotein|nr:peptidoglycan-associated lipoprotein Pal [Rhodoferax sp.]MBP9059314.1 peptidoglycan-associated lipoprotein Pal [Rhodoferax sp.]MBP9684022.1 peptidoglycan-associated lipoprotein Pal [Rhodoferax sp.]
MKRFLLAMGVSFFIAGCGSPVKLNDVPVVDKGATTVQKPDVVSSVSTVSSTSTGTVAPVEIAKSTQQVVMPTGLRIVYFDYDSFVIKPEFQSVVESHARYIKADKSRKVVIEGHTDERGGREYNLALGQKRAEAVRSALGLLGVIDNQLEAVSFGKEKPAALGSDEAAMAKNRRAEISYR